MLKNEKKKQVKNGSVARKLSESDKDKAGDTRRN